MEELLALKSIRLPCYMGSCHLKLFKIFKLLIYSLFMIVMTAFSIWASESLKFHVNKASAFSIL